MPLNNFGVALEAGYGTRLLCCAQPDAEGLTCLDDLGTQVLVALNGSLDQGFPGVRLMYELPTFTVADGQIMPIVENVEACLAAGKTTCVHCTHGRDRTWMVVGAVLLRRGVSLEEVNRRRALYGVYGIVEIADHAINEFLERVAAKVAADKQVA